MQRTYVSIQFTPAVEAVITQADQICADYRSQGFSLTLRQLYYQFVARGLLPNRQQSYNRLGRIISDARLAGALDWDYINDRGRNLTGDYAGLQATPEQTIRDAAEGYFEDLWNDQPYRIEVWIEKEALIDVVRRACGGLRVPHFACKGYVSQSEMWAAGRRFREHAKAGREPLVIHLGDHDPSGIDMTRDIEDRLSMFAERSVQIRRIALNMDQVRQYSPPPNPAKFTDSRIGGYVQQFGYESWELDALDPATLVDLIRAEIRRWMDQDAWQAAVAQEARERDALVAIADRWPEIQDYLGESE